MNGSLYRSSFIYVRLQRRRKFDLDYFFTEVFRINDSEQQKSVKNCEEKTTIIYAMVN